MPKSRHVLSENLCVVIFFSLLYFDKDKEKIGLTAQLLDWICTRLNYRKQSKMIHMFLNFPLSMLPVNLLVEYIHMFSC